MTSKITKVLMVDDDEDDFIITQDYLHEMTTHTFEIDWISSPKEALEILQKNLHDICLLDYQLGALDGLSVLKKAIKNGCTVPIIMLTGQSDSSLDNSALDAGAVDYLIKNEINLTLFTRAIRYALARKDFENERLERIKAETSNRSKDKFLAHLSHELRTPLTSILGYTELLLNKHRTKPVHSELTTIFNNGKHLLGLLNNVLDLSKIAANRLELNCTSIALHPFIANIYDLMEINAKDKGLSFTIESKTTLPQHIFNDPIRLRQVLINIIHNAIKFTTKGGINVRIHLQDIQGVEMLCFDIQDSGIGIPDTLLENIFKPFEQIEDVVSRNEEGAGLGLAICSELVKLMHGRISVVSEINKGSCFTIQIPPYSPDNEERIELSLADKESYQSHENYAPLQGKILVVDDIQDIRQLIGYFSESFGLEVHYADNGQTAVDLVLSMQNANTPYDLILMDIHMPKLDGKRAISKLRAHSVTNPILAVTAATMKGVRDELKSLGFNDVVAKPIEKSSLYNSLKQFLPHAEISQEIEETTLEILIVDDDSDAANITALLLESLAVKAHVAHSAEHCKTSLADNPNINTLLLDYHLPDMDGISLANQLKDNNANLNIIMLSGSEISNEAMRTAGAAGKLLKPINLEMLQRMLETLN
ncbi:response regulator [Catenovulum sediminis]|uniref:histidine kinase n=1 Tax=Catenovulum sediminis TaxID=1740262 RepID=A0ABV1RJD9_9ALTE|nr:response regulator [Catenovulum sediminis]